MIKKVGSSTSRSGTIQEKARTHTQLSSWGVKLGPLEEQFQTPTNAGLAQSQTFPLIVEIVTVILAI